MTLARVVVRFPEGQRERLGAVRERYFRETIFARQPSGKFMSSFLGRLFFDWYYMRLLIYVTPQRIHYWPGRDFAAAPQLIEVAHVA